MAVPKETRLNPSYRADNELSRLGATGRGCNNGASNSEITKATKS
jgi:hypothetical protein